MPTVLYPRFPFTRAVRNTGGGLIGYFHSMSPRQQARRIRELGRAGLPAELIAVLTCRGVDAVREALNGARP